MEEQQSEKAYGEGFRVGVSRLLEEVEKLGFVPKDMRAKLTTNAAKLCLVEAIAEKQADEIKERALKEWKTQAPELKATAERVSAALKRLFPNVAADSAASEASESPPKNQADDSTPEA